MDANLKLAKKKRVAHTGSKLPSISCEEPKLPPDDFVYNIMKDMDKQKNVISYQQLQEFKSQKRQDASINEDIISYHKPTKKMVPKKTFPLMKKCQTSLKHLKKNRCIPKARAHVGSIPKPPFKPDPKPQFKPILNVEKNITEFQHGSSSSINKSKKSQSKYKSTISQPEFKVRKTSTFKNCASKETVNHVKKKAQEEKQLSSSDDDAFEHFVQKANEKKSDSSDSDTDSRLIIHRKRSKTKSKQIKKKTKDSFSDKEVNRNVPKITSRLLSDSSENEEPETFEGISNKRNSFKRRKYSEHDSPKRLQANDKGTYISLSEDSRCLSDMNRDSSDSESNLEIPTSSLLSINQSNPFVHSALKSSGNIKENKVTHSTINAEIINFDSNSCYPDPTKRMPECNVPCYVRLVRDLELDKKAMNLCLTSPILPTSDMSSDDDCIIIDENSDNEELPEVPKSLAESSGTSWPCEDTDQGYSDTACEIPKQDLDPQVVESHTTCEFSTSKSPLSNTQANTTVLVHGLDGIHNLSDSNHHSISTELATSAKDSLNQHSLKTETDMDECVIVCEKSNSDAPEKILESDSSISEKIANPDLFSQAKDEIPSTEYNEANTNISEMGDFNVKIVAVQSLSELVEPSAPESNDVEVIDLSDDDSQMIDVKGKCEPDPKILEIMSKIDFESLKEIMSKIKVEKPTNEFCQVGESSASDLFPTCTSIPMPTCEMVEICEEINSTKRIGFQEQNSKLDNKKDQLHDSLELTPEKTDSQVISLNDSVRDCHTSNQTLRNYTDERIQIVDNEITNSLYNVRATEILAEVSSENLVKETNPLPKVNCITPSSLENRTVTNVAGMLPIHSKQYSDNASNQFCETVQNCSDAVCKSLKVIESQTIEKTKTYQDSSSVCRTTLSNTEISTKVKPNVPELADKQCKISKVRNEKSIPNYHIMQPVKRELVIESPSDELDIIAASYINDLQPSSKQVLTLLSLYKEEYKKYKDIKNTETNVNAGLKMLHDKQVNTLLHLQASIENLVKRDPCLYKINQEDNCNNIKISVKNEITDKGIIKKENPENSKELRREGPSPEKDVKAAIKFESAGPSREQVYTTMMMNYKCALCGKPATARCQGCRNIFYCSSQCGQQSWRQGHDAVCKKS